MNLKNTKLRFGAVDTQVKKQVRALHKNLRQLGFDIPIWEYYAKRLEKGTETCVKEFQERHSLKANGLVDQHTMQKISIEADRARRHYGSSLLPVFNSKKLASSHQDALRVLYGEVCNSWRMLTDVRFKLLGFVPTASIVLLIGLLAKSTPGEGLSEASRLAICIVGLFVTTGLYIYDRRNTELYDDLVSRGRRIEYELGIDTGQFLGRRNPSVFFIKHDLAIGLIYGSAIFAWLFAVYIIWSRLL